MRRKRYYHKTIVLTNLFSSTPLLLLAVLFTTGIFVSILGRIPINLGRNTIMHSFDAVFQKGEIASLRTTVYDRIFSVIPSVKSGEEMMKKHSAKYGGVKKKDKSEVEPTQEETRISGRIKAMDMSASGKFTFRNETGYAPNVEELLPYPLAFQKDAGSPQVLIMHTHTSEAYAQSPNGRTTDNTQNVVRVGEIIKNQLEERGISVVHDTTRNDYPAYNGSYSKALAGIQAQLDANPTIEVVLDIHRDYAEQTQNGEAVQLKPVAEINGEQVAQVMLVVGTDGLGLSHPNWKHNLAFAVQIQQALNDISPNLARPINLRRERFNQHLTKGSLIVEVGTAGNSVSECERTAVYIGNAVASVLNGE